MKKYQFGFGVWGLALFLLIMVPNFIRVPNAGKRECANIELRDTNIKIKRLDGAFWK